jgi:hypothetical protein
MRNTLYGYYRPTKREFDKIWKNCLIIPDTNVLLNLYRYSKETSDDFLNIFNSFSDRMWLPYQVALEYQKNRLNVITTQQKVYSNLVEVIKKQENLINSELHQIGKHPVIDFLKYEGQISSFFSDIIKQIEFDKMNHPDLLENDYIRDSITSLFDGKVGLPYSPDELSVIIKEAKLRFDNHIPPGYEDLKTKDETNAYSDLIIWYQIIDRAKKENRPIIFITDELKNDWWWKFNGKIIGPRPELVEEIVKKANVWFYLYRPDQFLTYSKSYLKQQINQKSIKEIRDIQKQDNEKSKYSSFLQNKINEFNYQINDIEKTENSILYKLNLLKENLIEAKLAADHYQRVDIEPGYQMKMLEVDEYQNQCYELEKRLAELNIQKNVMKNELLSQINSLSKLKNEDSRIDYQPKQSSSTLKKINK